MDARDDHFSVNIEIYVRAVITVETVLIDGYYRRRRIIISSLTLRMPIITARRIA